MFTPLAAFAQGTVPGVDRSPPVALPLAGGCFVPGAWIWKRFAPGTPARIRWIRLSPGHVPALEVSGRSRLLLLMIAGEKAGHI